MLGKRVTTTRIGNKPRSGIIVKYQSGIAHVRFDDNGKIEPHYTQFLKITGVGECIRSEQQNSNQMEQ